MPSVTVIIPVYKKHELLLASLTNNVPFLAGAKIIIINDDPNSQLHEDHYNGLRNDIIFLKNEKNLGFSKTVNIAAKSAYTDFIMLLNSDVFLSDKNWQKTIECFENDPKLFAISFAQDDGSGKITGRNKLYFQNGLFHHSSLPISDKSEILDSKFEKNDAQGRQNVECGTWNLELLPTAWAEGGSAIFRKSMWDDLKGFDENFSPFYWEDVDLSYRAKAKGWKVLFLQDIKVLHKHESTIGSFFDKEKINKTAFANQIYFTKKHANLIQKIELYSFLLKRKIKSIVI